MPLSPSEEPSFDSVSKELVKLIEQLPNVKHSQLIQRALAVLVRIADEEIDRLDWKILTGSLEDLERGLAIFYPYRHVRKVTIFGSARIGDRTPEYQMAVEFARYLTKRGYMVMTGAGGGIMQAGNEGAGRENSFGLNIQLPFEQGANAFIEGDEKLINFKYFFTRKLFFLRESDAIALFPGGYGTQDEAFECLTLCQTGRYGPVPLVLIDKPGGDYWISWHDYICQHLVKRGLVSPEDPSLYTITDDVEIAATAIDNFYRVYHSSRYVGELFVMRLNHELLDAQVEELNDEFSDLLTKGKITKSESLPEEAGDETVDLPRIVFYFNQRDLGRLYQMISLINQWEIHSEAEEHPERK
ncbi:MAG: LOG family protein [Oscillatoria sp. PMC 1068.18]|nr:LOG family protein [Oscillatoria sp. PMC 1076.18]MEC4987626.1 LOG family protein [Oscillatoria sp. PMC 1068.18]